MNHDVVGIPPAVSVLRKRSHRHIILYHCIVSYRAFVPVVRFFFPKAIPHILLTEVSVQAQLDKVANHGFSGS